MNARDYFTLLRESKFLIAACLVLCVALAGGVTVLTPKTYASSVTFYVVAGTTVLGQQNPTSDLYQGAELAKDRVKSYSELIVGPRVAGDAATRLGNGATAADIQSRLTVSAVDDTVIITLGVTGSTPVDTVRVLDAVAASFTEVVDEIETRPGGAGPVITARQLEAPVLPQFAVAPKLSLNLVIGFLLGLVIGFGVAVARRTMDVSVRTPEVLESVTEAAVLGIVPEEATRSTRATKKAAKAKRRAGKATTNGQSFAGGIGSGACAEAFRRIRTNLEFSNVDGTRRVLVVTSALPDEGKTTTACNLAAALAAIGAHVVLVEGDLRRPSVAAFLGLENSVGVTTVLTGKVELTRALQTGTVGGFDVLAGGRTPPRPNELLSSRRAASLINELRARYDFVLIDAPPILPVADAVNLGTHADGAIVVCRWGTTSRHHIASAVSFLRAVSVPIVGTVLSRAPGRPGAAWTYYGTYTGDESDQEAMTVASDAFSEVNGSTVRIPSVHRPDDCRTEDAGADAHEQTVGLGHAGRVPAPAMQNGHHLAEVAAHARPSPSGAPRPRPRPPSPGPRARPQPPDAAL